jgi:arylsulfate sulfotransferase
MVETIGLADVVGSLTENRANMKFHQEEINGQPRSQNVASDNIVAIDDAIYNSMHAEFTSKSYPLTDPFIRQDPYSASPLTLQAGIETDVPTRLSITISAPGAQTIAHDFFDGENYTTQHFFPVIGLFPDAVNTIDFTIVDEQGNPDSHQMTVQAPATPSDFGIVEVKQPAQTTRMNQQFYITSVANSYPAAIDYTGTVRWYLDETSSTKHFQGNSTIILLNNGRLLTCDSTLKNLIEFDQLGRIYRITPCIYDGNSFTAHHDIIQMPNGNLLIQAQDDSPAALVAANNTERDMLAVMDYTNGEIINMIDFKDILDVNRKFQPPTEDKNSGRIDWLHENSIDFHTATNVYITSSRVQNVIVATDQETNAIKWMIGSRTNWDSKYAPYLLTPVDASGTELYDFTNPADVTKADHEFWTWGQHSARALPDDYTTPGGDLDLIVFDDGAYRSLNHADVIASYNNWSRAVRFSINTRDMTVRLVWEYGKELGQAYYCGYVGNVQYVPESNSMMINFGGTNEYPETGRNVGIHGEVPMGDFPPSNYDDPTRYPVQERVKMQEVALDGAESEVLFEFWQYNPEHIGINQNCDYKMLKADLYTYDIYATQKLANASQ